MKNSDFYANLVRGYMDCVRVNCWLNISSGVDLEVSHCRTGDESVCDFEWDDGL